MEQSDQTVNFVSNVIALIAAIPVILLLFQASSIKFEPIVLPPIEQTIEQTIVTGAAVLLGLVLLGIVYFIFHTVFGWFLRPIERFRLGREQQRSERYYYEMDVQLNVSITEDKAKELLDKVEQDRKWWEKLKGWLKGWWSVRPDHEPYPLRA